MSMWAEMWRNLIDPAHIIPHLAWEAISGVVLYPAAKYIFRQHQDRHDREVHGIQHTEREW